MHSAFEGRRTWPLHVLRRSASDPGGARLCSGCRGRRVRRSRLVAVGASSLLAVVIVCRYERLPRLGEPADRTRRDADRRGDHILPASGERYAPLYLAVASSCRSTSAEASVRPALVAIVSGPLALRASSAGGGRPDLAPRCRDARRGRRHHAALRDRLSRTAEQAKSQRACSTRSSSMRPPASGSSTRIFGTFASTRRSPRSWVTSGRRSKGERCESSRR